MSGNHRKAIHFLRHYAALSQVPMQSLHWLWHSWGKQLGRYWKTVLFFARFRLHGEWIYTITIRSPSVCTRASSQSCNLWCIIFYVLILRTSNMLRNKSEVQYRSMEHCLDLVMLLLSYCIVETDPPSCSDAILPKPFLRGYFLNKIHKMIDVLDTEKATLLLRQVTYRVLSASRGHHDGTTSIEVHAIVVIKDLLYLGWFGEIGKVSLIKKGVINMIKHGTCSYWVWCKSKGSKHIDMGREVHK